MNKLIAPMNKQIYITALLTLLIASISIKSENIEIKKIDHLIKERTTFIEQKEDKINYLKQLRSKESDRELVYNITNQIIEEYSNYQSDSAFMYIEANKKIALATNDQKQIIDNLFKYIFVCAQAGLLNEAEKQLQTLYPKVSEMNTIQKVEFYNLYNRLYMNLREFSQNSPLERKYRDLENLYCDTVLMYAPLDSKTYNLYQFKKAFTNNDLELAKENILYFISKIDSLSNDAARAYYYLYQIADLENETTYKMNYLTQSVSIDLKSAVMQNRSLRVLAEYLYQSGDISRAYQYMSLSLADANFYNTRLRNSQVAEVLQVVEKDFQIQRNKQELRMTIVIILTIVLLICLVAVCIYLRIKKKELMGFKNELLKTNNELKAINIEIETNNNVLTQMSIQLKESDELKEKYLGHFIKLCSTYIKNITVFKKNINRKIKLGQIEEVHNMTLSSMQESADFKEFYEEFDQSFLNIYPDFVTKFNLLLKEDQRFQIKKENALNTELRIYALLRLGIKDSSQIADFMNYTPVTIYSYRTKVKSRAINKDTFEEDILRIN